MELDEIIEDVLRMDDNKHLERLKRMIDKPAVDTIIIETYPPEEIPSDNKNDVSAGHYQQDIPFPSETGNDAGEKKVVSYVVYRRKRRNTHRKSIINRSKKQRIQSRRQRYKARRREAAIRSIKISAVCLRRRLSKFGVPRKDVAAYLNIRERTLKNWEDNWDRNRLSIKRLGRPIKLSSVEIRNRIFSTLLTIGPTIGIAYLQDMYPDVPPVEIEDLVIRYRNLCERNNELVLTHTKWKTPGTVWAMDFSTPPGKHLIDGIFSRACAVRDLSSGFQLAWDAAMAEDTKAALKVIRTLFVIYRKPLVLKVDNGSPFISDAFIKEMNKEKVYILFSPPQTPQYNGAVEAGNGWMEYWTNDSSYYHGCHGRWSIDDMVSARMRGNQTIRTEKTIGILRREELWDARPAITKDIRAEFEDRIVFERKRAREKLNLPPELDKSRAGQAIVDRIAIPRALCGMGFLEYRKERISELIFQE